MKKILNPPFLQNIDRWLMLHKPSLWKTNLHYVIFYTLLSLVLQTTIAILYPVDIRSMVETESIYAYLIIPASICAILWVVKMVQYNIHHTYVKQSILEEFGVFSFNIIALLLITTQVYVMPTIFNWKNAHTITHEENLIIDKGLFFLADGMSYGNNYNARKYNYESRSYYYEPIREAIYNSENDTYTLSYNSPNRLGKISLQLDTVSFEDVIERPDENPYNTTNTYYRSRIKRKELISHLDRFKDFHNHWYPEAKLTLTSEKIISDFIMKKKANTYDSLTTETYNYEWITQDGIEPYRSQVTNVLYINDLIDDIENAKGWEEDIFDLVFTTRATLWLITIIAFILWIITLVRWQQIFATIIVIALSPIIIGPISIFLFGVVQLDFEFWAPLLLLLIYGFFFIQAVMSNYKNSITIYKNIVTIIVTLLLPLVPILVMAWSWEEYIRGTAYYDDFHEYRLIFGVEYHLFQDLFLIVGEALIFIFVFVAIAIFGKILKKQLALPRNN